jgi:hypothetical protein
MSTTETTEFPQYWSWNEDGLAIEGRYVTPGETLTFVDGP